MYFYLFYTLGIASLEWLFIFNKFKSFAVLEPVIALYIDLTAFEIPNFSLITLIFRISLTLSVNVCAVIPVNAVLFLIDLHRSTIKDADLNYYELISPSTTSFTLTVCISI